MASAASAAKKRPAAARAAGGAGGAGAGGKRKVGAVGTGGTGSRGAAAGKLGVIKKGKDRPPQGRVPASFKADYPIILRLRAPRDAPVDTVGCERLADPKAKRVDYEWQCLVAAMLSSQTKDQTTAEAMAILHKHGNTIPNIARTPVQRLDKLICKVGFHLVKAGNLRAAANLCIERHSGRIPQTLEGLMELPGVGPKMAYLTMHAAFDQQEGLCIDTHIHRIANDLGWLKPPSKTPEQTRVSLESWLPKRYWPEFNIVMVGFGQMQQQVPHKLVDRCVAGRSSATALRLLARLGVQLRPGRFPALDAAAAKRTELKRLLLASPSPSKNKR